jgi:hypothetical protein
LKNRSPFEKPTYVRAAVVFTVVIRALGFRACGSQAANGSGFATPTS